MMAFQSLISALGREIEDPEEETFLLFSQDIPSQNLGFVDAKATNLEITVSNIDLNITQSPGLLSSDREGGTTGAVVWKITPLFAEWVASDDSLLFQYSALDQHSTVLELGCGISGIVAVSLAPRIGKYIATDQGYVFKWLKPNITNNSAIISKNVKKRGKTPATTACGPMGSNIKIIALDWETSSVSELPTLVGMEPGQIFDAVVACDCVYNETLIEPLVRTCAETCQLANASSTGKPTVCIIAQQLRSDTVFEAWLIAFHKVFRVWRVPDKLLNKGLREGSSFVVHIGIFRESRA